jgi:fermentation-respiration switch protein FrsA (DUF1100 family)
MMTAVRRRALCVLFLAMGLGTVMVGIRFVARSYLFPISEIVTAQVPNDFERHTLLARDGVTVHALGLPAPPDGRTIVYFHNNRETAGSRTAIARALHARGFGVLLIEYRGYGVSRGAAPSEDGLYLDAECALDMLASRGIRAEQVVLWGTSLGTGVAAEMARRGRGARLVLESPYTSIPGLVADAAPLIPARILVPDRFDTLSKSQDIRIPTLVIHGDADEVVPFWMGERLARAIRGAKLLRIVGAHHGDLFAREGERLLAEIAASGS